MTKNIIFRSMEEFNRTYFPIESSANISDDPEIFGKELAERAVKILRAVFKRLENICL